MCPERGQRGLSVDAPDSTVDRPGSARCAGRAARLVRSLSWARDHGQDWRLTSLRRLSCLSERHPLALNPPESGMWLRKAGSGQLSRLRAKILGASSSRPTPPFRSDDRCDLLQRFGREYGAHLAVTRLVPPDIRDGPELPKELAVITVDGERSTVEPFDLPVATWDHREAANRITGDAKSRSRARSEELATRVLGLRTDHAILASPARVVERAQFTELDRRLLARADAQGRVSYAGPFLKDRRRLAERSQELRRLEVLVSLGLARRIGAGRWALSRELEPTLRQCQLAGDIMKSRARHQAHLSDPRLPLVVTRIEAGTRLAGRVVGTGLADELRDRRYLLLEGTDRRLHYILQTPDVERARGQARFHVGDHITLTGHAVTREGRTMVTTEIQV